MERWQLWRRVWLRLQHRSQSRRRYAVASRTRSDPEGRTSRPGGHLMLGRRHFSFIGSMAAGITQRPKVLLEVDCSNLLLGGSTQYENFSSTCWLEDHLHRFGDPTTESSPTLGPQPNFEYHGATELEVSSSSADSSEDFSVSSGSSRGWGVRSMRGSNSSGSVISGDNLVIDLHRYPYIDGTIAMIEPPPYHGNDPPPSYEEAIAGNDLSDFEENTDFMW